MSIVATAFNGANAAFIADLYARWWPPPPRVDPSFAELFGALNDEARAVLEDASGASWAPRKSAPPNPSSAAPASRRRMAPPSPPSPSRCAPRPRTACARLMLIRTYRVRGHLEASSTRSACRFRRRIPSSIPTTYGFTDADMDRADLHRQRARPAKPPRCGEILADPARDLLRPDRRRVHAHPGPRPEGLDPAPGRGRALAHAISTPTASARILQRTDRGRGLRGVLPEALRRHQALRPGRRRGHHPGDARHHRDRRRRRRATRSPSACRIAAGSTRW